MPCNDPDYGARDRIERERIFQLLTRATCDYCKEIEARGDKIPLHLLGWWINHQEQDKIRLEKEAKAEHEKQIREQALLKLSPEERQILKIKIV